jgi:lipopolysaccharide export system protein LptC
VGLLPAAEEHTTSFTVNSPVIDFRVPTFTQEGFRSWLLRGEKGLYVNDTELDVEGLNLIVFAGNASNQVEKVFLSPLAVALINEGRVRGPTTLRLITDDFEATGEDWLYDHRQKKVSIHRNVRVVFHAPLNDILR